LSSRCVVDIILIIFVVSKIGSNASSNRLYVMNGKIPLDWLNLSLDSFKIKCKNNIFLQ
jgi:hypothetical protein